MGTFNNYMACMIDYMGFDGEEDRIQPRGCFVLMTLAVLDQVLSTFHKDFGVCFLSNDVSLVRCGSIRQERKKSSKEQRTKEIKWK